MNYAIIEKKVDEQGRIVLPKDWIKKMVEGGGNVFVIRYKDYIKIIPKKIIHFSHFYEKAKPSQEIDPFRDYERAVAKAIEKRVFT